MNIAKHQFVTIINAIIEQEYRDREISSAIDVVLRDGQGQGSVFATKLVDEAVNALDVDGVISWWLWEGPDHGRKAEDFKINVNGKSIAIHDAGELYDYMVEAQK